MTRYYEVNVDEKFKAESDFVYRKRNGTLWKAATHYLIAALLVMALFALDLHNKIGVVGAIITIMCIMAGVSIHSIIAIQKHLDLVTSIEFQNALFSSAFRNGKLFSLIISKEDQLYYADSKFYKLFPDLIKNNSLVLDNIIAQSENSQGNLEILNEALIKRQTCDIDVFIDIENERELVRISLTPLPRPSGYFFVSARTFQVNRNNVSENSNFSAEDAKQLLNDLFTNQDEIAYLLDNDSEIMACTDGFARLVGAVDAHKLVDRKITDFVANVENYSPLHFNKAAFNHDFLEFKGKNGAIIATNISHFYIHNHDNSPKITLGKIVLANMISG